MSTTVQVNSALVLRMRTGQDRVYLVTDKSDPMSPNEKLTLQFFVARGEGRNYVVDELGLSHDLVETTVL